MEYGFLSLIPPIIAIGLAFWKKNVFVALFAAVFSGSLIVSNFNPVNAVTGLLQVMIEQLSKTNNIKAIIAILMVGGMIKLIEEMGGVNGLVRVLLQKRSIIKSQKGALLLTWLIGVLVFTTGGMSILVTGTVSTPLCKAMKVAPEKNALVIHATSSPVTVSIPFSAMGANAIGFLGAIAATVGASENIYYESLPFFFTPIIFIFGTLLVILTGFDFPGMKKAIKNYEKSLIKTNSEIEDLSNFGKGKARYFVLPMIFLIFFTVIFMLITGNGNFIKGNGMDSFIYAALISLFSTITMALIDKLFSLDQCVNIFLKGCGDMIFIAAILVFAYTFSGFVTTLGTGQFLGSLISGSVPAGFVPFMIFLIGSTISMSTGSLSAVSQTIAPIAIPLAAATGISIPLAVGAVYSGGVLGDCASIISDNTILTCSTTKCDVMSHVKTQMPYVIVNFIISSILFLALGFIM